MAATYAVVRFAFALSRHLARGHWHPIGIGGWIVFWVLAGGVVLGNAWASEHARDCDSEFPGATLIRRDDPAYRIVRDCHDYNRSERRGRMLAVALVLGIAAASGVRSGRRISNSQSTQPPS